MNNFIEIYKNVLSKEYCEEVIDLFERLNDSGFCKNRQQREGTEKLRKDDSSVMAEEIFTLDHTSNKLFNHFNNTLWDVCYKDYSNKYDVLKGFSRHQSYCYKVQKTKPGQGYHLWHAEADSRNVCNRILVWTAYLNDEFEAGETEFLYQQYRYKPSQGDIIIFPAAFTHVHRGNPPIGGDKYIITGWIEF